MKPRNFPAKKLKRQLRAQYNDGRSWAEVIQALREARAVRTKQKRGAS